MAYSFLHPMMVSPSEVQKSGGRDGRDQQVMSYAVERCTIIVESLAYSDQPDFVDKNDVGADAMISKLLPRPQSDCVR